MDGWDNAWSTRTWHGESWNQSASSAGPAWRDWNSAAGPMLADLFPQHADMLRARNLDASSLRARGLIRDLGSELPAERY